MSRSLYRYTFGPEVPPEEIEATLVLALLAAESLHGESLVLLDGAHHFDPDRRACILDAGSAVGIDLNKLFVGFLRREFDEAFRVERVAAEERQAATAAV
jgi:hypothetical protein